MNEAIEVIFKGVFKKIADCARLYEINRNTLLRRLYERSSRSAPIAFNKRLIDAEEHSLMTYIRYYDEKNLSITPKLLAEAANFLIHARDPSAKPVGDPWFKRFLKRHLEDASFEALQTDEAGQILSVIEDLESSYPYLNSGDGDYITPYHSDTLIGFAPLYRLQKYRYTEPRLSPLAFLDR